MFCPLDSHCHIGGIVVSQIVVLRFCPIHFTVTFAETYKIKIFTFELGISLYWGSTVDFTQVECTFQHSLASMRF